MRRSGRFARAAAHAALAVISAFAAGVSDAQADFLADGHVLASMPADSGDSSITAAGVRTTIYTPPNGFTPVPPDGTAASGGSALTGDFTPAPIRVSNIGGFTIVINPTPALAGNAAALAAFYRAANQWVARIADPITVNISADLAPLGPGIIGSASSVLLQAGYNVIRNQMVADAADEGADDAIVASVPTAATFTGIIPSGSSFTGNLVASKANLKALGFDSSGLDLAAGTTTDAFITFSNAFSFDFDNSNGVGPGLTDFETVAAHEIGHALGFFSVVDEVDAGATGIDPNPFDLFRFENGTANDPATVADFATFARSLTANTASNFDDIMNAFRLSTGVNTGDGRQASHWRDDALSGITIGIMDPTLAAGVATPVQITDLRVLDLIGYEIVTVPEPGGLLLMGLGLAGVIGYRRFSSRSRPAATA
jgi:hypothetical protein